LGAPAVFGIYSNDYKNSRQAFPLRTRQQFARTKLQTGTGKPLIEWYTTGTVAFISENVKLQQGVVTEF